jgi:hypothetical protein
VEVGGKVSEYDGEAAMDVAGLAVELNVRVLDELDVRDAAWLPPTVGEKVGVMVAEDDDVAVLVRALEPVGDGLRVGPTHSGLTAVVASAQKASAYQSNVSPPHSGLARPGDTYHVDVAFTATAAGCGVSEHWPPQLPQVPSAGVNPMSEPANVPLTWLAMLTALQSLRYGPPIGVRVHDRDALKVASMLT